MEKFAESIKELLHKNTNKVKKIFIAILLMGIASILLFRYYYIACEGEIREGFMRENEILQLEASVIGFKLYLKEYIGGDFFNFDREFIVSKISLAQSLNDALLGGTDKRFDEIFIKPLEKDSMRVKAKKMGTLLKQLRSVAFERMQNTRTFNASHKNASNYRNRMDFERLYYELIGEIHKLKTEVRESILSDRDHSSFIYKSFILFWVLILFGIAAGIWELIRQRKQTEREISFMAYHDLTTELPNRRAFNNYLSIEFERAERNNEKLAVIFLDLDRFKNINDSYGHAAGDMLLTCIAKRLNNCLRKYDIVARWGGDEFAIILPQMGCAQNSNRIARKIIKLFKTPFEIGEHTIYVTSSIGVAIYPDDCHDLNTLVKNADIAMYAAKDSGKNNCKFYMPAMNANTPEISRIETLLHKALDAREFTLVYQPQIELRTGRIVSVEALLRWESPELGLVGPNKFIHVAEESGLILDIGKWVLREAANQNKAWQKAGYPSVCMAVNLSALQFYEKDLKNIILDILRKSGLESQWLELEITETKMMQDTEKSIKILRQLRESGIQVALDDFGTGYSSLSYLKRFPIDTLKIDCSFLKNITTDKKDQAIASAIIIMAHSMDLKVIAEGVETDEQLKVLNKLDCNIGQGFLFSKPLSAQDICRFWETRHVARQAVA